MDETNINRDSFISVTPKLWHREYLKVLTCNFLLYFAFFLLTPLLPIYLYDQFNADKDVIGIVLSGYVIATLIVRPFSGFIVDAFNRKKVLMICFFLFFVLFTGYVGAGTLLMFGIIRTIHGFPFGATTVANSTVAIDVVHPARRNEAIGYYGLSNNLAMAIAPSAGIYIYQATKNFSLLFWLAFLLAMIGFICSMTIKVPQREQILPRPKFNMEHFFLTKAWILAVNICFFGVCWGVMSNYVALYGKQELNMTDGTGIYFMLMAIGLFTSRLYGGKSLRAGNLTKNATLGVILGLIGYCMFAFLITPWSYFISAFVIGFGNGQMYPAFMNMFINIARPDQRGTANSSIMTSWDTGTGLGIILGGYIAEYFGFYIAFVTVAVMQGVGTLLYFLATKKFYYYNRYCEHEV